MRRRVVYVHFNKQNSADGFPWTIHTQGRCIPARSVVFRGTRVETVWKPLKKTNPRGFIKTRGFVQMQADGAAVIW